MTTDYTALDAALDRLVQRNAWLGGVAFAAVAADPVVFREAHAIGRATRRSTRDVIARRLQARKESGDYLCTRGRWCPDRLELEKAA